MNAQTNTAPPVLLLGSTLLFWGWQTELWLYAIPMAILLELPHWTESRWALLDKDFNRLMDLTSLAWLVTALYLFNQESIQGLFVLLSWMPIIFFILILAQSYSLIGSVQLSSLFLSLRRRKNEPFDKIQINPAKKRIHLGYPYFILCLLAASAGQQDYFFIGIFLLISWALWIIRPTRYWVMTWVFLLSIGFSLGYVGHVGLFKLQNQIEDMIVSWFQDMMWRSRDPYRQNTAIGDIGELKESDQIILRVQHDVPLLLREATYNSYFRGTWQAQTAIFRDLAPLSNSDQQWPLVNLYQHNVPANTDANVKQLAISLYLAHGRAMLPLPTGSFMLDNLQLPDVSMNDFGAVKVERGPGLIYYQASYTPQQNWTDAPPSNEDIKVPEEEQAVFQQLVKELGLIGQPPEVIVEKVAQHFSTGYRYSLLLSAPTYSSQPSEMISPMRNFLYFKRSGHCEYYATATVLLLRAAGLPARYAAGFAAQEYSRLERAYLVRKRHAHAWALVYINGYWQTLDTTPGSWFELEENRAAWWQSIYDVFSWAYHLFSKWRWNSEQEAQNNWLLWLLVPLFLLLFWRLYMKKRVKKQPLTLAQIAHNRPSQGLDSAFFLIVNQLQKQGYVRQPGETLAHWLYRLEQTHLHLPPIEPLLTLHQRYRFDPAYQFNTEEQAKLQAQVQHWLNHLASVQQ